MTNLYYYGMLYRGFAPGAQPKGVIRLATDEEIGRLDLADTDYYNVIVYDRMLTDREIREYEIRYLGCWLCHHGGTNPR